MSLNIAQCFLRVLVLRESFSMEWYSFAQFVFTICIQLRFCINSDYIDYLLRVINAYSEYLASTLSNKRTRLAYVLTVLRVKLSNVVKCSNKLRLALSQLQLAAVACICSIVNC